MSSPFPPRPGPRNVASDPTTLIGGKKVAPAPETLPVGSPIIPTRIADISVVGILGRGAMGVVYKAWQADLKRHVALKVVRQIDSCGEASARVRREAEAVARLSHPHIVRIHGIAEHDRMPVLILEYVEGRPLDRVIDGRPQPVAAAAKCVELMARGMAHAHAQGVLHRDLKPANVLMEGSAEAGLPDLVPRISDFGLARDLDASASGTVLAGTPSYMSPEQAAGRTNELGPASDIHALGAILYEMLVGRPPFRGEDVMGTLNQVMTLTPVSPSRLRPGIPRDLETICLKCLRKEASRRYASASELADDLAAFLDGRPIKARPVSVTERLYRASRRYPVVTGLMLAVILCVVVGVATVASEHHEAVVARVSADQKATLAETRLARLALDRGISTSENGDIRPGLLWLARSLRIAADVRTTDLEHPIRVDLATYRRSLTRPAGEYDHTAHLKSHPSAALLGEHRLRVMAVSPADGTVATGDDKGYVQLWGNDGKPRGEPLAQLFLLEMRSVSAIAFSPDGRYMATGTVTGDVRCWDVKTRRQVGGIRRHGKSDVWCLAFAKDGQRFFSGGYDGRVRPWSVDDNKPVGPALECSKEEAVYAMAFHPKDPVLYVGTRGGHLQAWNPFEGRQVAPPRYVDEFGVHALAVSPDGRTLVLGANTSARLYDLPLMSPRGFPLEHVARVDGVAVSPDGHLAASAGHDGWLRFWRVADGTPVGEVIRDFRRLNDVSFTPDGSRVVVVEFNGSVHLRTVPTDSCRNVSERRTRPVTSVRHVAAEGKCLAVSENEYIFVDAASGRVEQTWLPQRHFARRTAAITDDGKTAALAFWNRDEVEVIDRDRPGAVRARLYHPYDVMEMRWSPTGLLYTRTASDSSPAHGLRCWDPKEPTAAKFLIRDATCFALSADGKHLAVGSAGKVTMHDARTGKPVAGALPHRAVVTALAWSSDGRRVLTGCRDGSVRLWRDGVAVGKPFFHRAAVRCVAFGNDARTVLTGSADGTARFWDGPTGVPLGPALNHAGPVNDVLILADGSVLTASDDHHVRGWRMPEPAATGKPAELVAEMQRTTGRRLTEDDETEELPE